MTVGTKRALEAAARRWLWFTEGEAPRTGWAALITQDKVLYATMAAPAAVKPLISDAYFTHLRLLSMMKAK